MPMLRTAFVNAKVYTVDPRQPCAGAVVVDGNTIVYAGPEDGARAFVDRFTEIIDVRGNLMLPGFIDSHAHIVIGGFSLTSVDLSKARSRTEFRKILRSFVANHREQWITGGNWNHHNWQGSELPHREWIDDFTEDTPVFVSRMDYHMALANTCALSRAGVTRDTPDPDGGTIERDPATGEPTGILKDKAMEIVNAAIPEPTDQELDRAVKAALDEAKRFGVTSIHDICYKSHFRALQRAEQAGTLTCRAYTRLPIADHQHLIGAEIQHDFGSDVLKMGSMKAFADGSLGSDTALFFEPYSDNASTCGLAMDILTDGRLREWAITCDRHGLQLSIHAIGDRANAIMLDLFEEIIAVNPKWDRRFRIEHAQHLRPRDFARFAQLGIIASMQPLHLYDDGVWAERKIGKERLRWTYAFKSFLDAGTRVCSGSDWPVVTLNPLAGISTAVTRQTADGTHANGLVPEEKLSVEEAVACYTVNGAFAAYQEHKLGSIEVGKLADFVVLSEDIFRIAPEQITDVRVLMTVFNGEVIYGG